MLFSVLLRSSPNALLTGKVPGDLSFVGCTLLSIIVTTTRASESLRLVASP